MFFWNQYPFIRYSIFLLSGITGEIYLNLYSGTLRNCSIIWVMSICLYCVFFALRSTISIKYSKLLLNSLAMVFLGYSGVILIKLKNQTPQPNDLRSIDTYSFFTAKIISPVEKKGKEYKTVVEVESVFAKQRWSNVSGKIALTIYSDRKATISYGDKILLKGFAQPIRSPMNPGDFNYKEYLSHLQIYRTLKVNQEQMKLVGHSHLNPVMHWANSIRSYCDSILCTYIKNEREYEVAAALVLGIKGNLDSEIKQAYTNTGVIHVLAVSGLHIAIIYEVLLLLFGRFKSDKYGKYILYLGIAGTLWFFGFISGLSASVLRAVLMFSFVLVARLVNRDTEIYNTLAASAFFLLCYNPYLAIDPGFQLSYIAVAGIIYLQPKLYALLFLRNYIANKIWGLISVTLAAQLSTIPLILFYFHQIPVWFLPANLIMIPGTTIMLYLGVLLILFSWILPMAKFLGTCIQGFLWFLHWVLLKLEQLPAGMLSGLSIGVGECILLIGIIFSIFSFCSGKRLEMLMLISCFLGLLGFIRLYKTYQHNHQKLIAVYQINHVPVLALISGREAIFLADARISPTKIKQQTNNHFAELGIEKILFSTYDSTTSAILPCYRSSSYCLFIWGKRYFLYSPSGNIPNQLKKTLHIPFAGKIKNCLFICRPEVVISVVIMDEQKSWNRKIIEQIKSVHLPYHNIAQRGAYVHYIQ